MNYITFKKMFDYVDRIEKARSHKYIDRRPKKTGKGWYYIYAETFKKPFRALLEIFDIKKERIDKDYEEDNIQKDFGIDKNLYASHVLEFFLNREKWHNIFSKKENRQKYTQAVKQSDVEKKAKEKKEKSTEKKKTTTETTKTQKLNRSLMFRIWKRNTPEAEKLLEQDKERTTDEKVTFASNLENFVKNGMKGSTPLVLLSQTPKILKKYNIPDNPITLEPSIIKKILSSDENIRHAHNIPIEYLKDLPKQLENPLAIMKGKDDKKIILTEYSINDNPIITIIEIDKSTGKYNKVNSIRSVYDKEKNKLAEWLNNPDITEYTDKKRTMVLASIGLQLPKDGNPALSSSYSKILPQETENVNGEHGNKKAEDVIYTNDSQQLPGSRNASVAGTTRETKLPHFDSQNVNPNEVSDNSEEMSSTEHGNKTAMLGNQNAFKGHLSNQEKVKIVSELKGEPYEEWNTDVNKFAVYYNRETGKETGIAMTKDIADIIDSHNEPSVLDWQDNIAEDIHGKYPKIDKQYIREAIRAIRMGYKNGKKQNIKIIGEQSAESTVNEVKPQTDSEMKKEQENTKKARKEAGLPDINENALNPRVSVIDDLSWSPSSENYRYKDTGYIAGARKENALAFLRAAGRNKTRLRETDIDWVGVEENKRAAKEVIVKSNIFGQVDWATLKENGMTGGAAFLIDRIYSQIGKEPTKDSPEARKNYVIAVNGLRDRLETAKTVQDVENILKEIKDEMNGEFFSVRNTPEYQRRLAEIKEIDRKVGEIKDKAKELADVYRDQEVRETEKILELQKQWLKEHKVIRGNQKYLYGVENKMTPELKAEYDSYCEKMQAENRKESKRLYEEWMKFREENGRTVQANNKYYFADNRYTYIDYEIEREYYDKQQELKAYERKEGVQAVLQNPLYKAWIELGDRFDVIVRSGWKSKTFYQHKADARRGMYDDWAWADKEKIEVSRTGTNRKVQFEFKVAKNYERKGGRNVSVESTEQLKKAFNLRDIQSGNWVLKDPESAKWHVDRIAEGFADLSDVTGIPDNLISLNGRLAMAIGARGKGGAGAAKAHYEAVERVINITKMKGGGSLGHEWFHAFDNMITEAMGGTEGETRSFMTNKFAYLKPKDKELMMKYLKETNLYLKARYKQELDKKNIQIPEKSTEIFQVKVANAFDNLTKVMTEGNSVIKEKITYTHADYEQAVFNIKANATTTTGRKLFEAGNIDNAMNILNGIYTDHKSKVKTKWYKLAAAFYCGNADVERGYARIDMGRRGASFLAGALDLDEGTEKYWAEPHEMAARAFSAYIDDKLRSQGRFNDYLANYTENKYYKDPILGDSFPYPEGEERKRINAAFDELFETIKSENAIRKALLFEESAHPRGNGGQFIKKFAADKGANFGESYEALHINTKFNEELEEYKKGNLPSNHIFKLGKPNEILVKVGFPANDDIELRANQLQIKLDKHNFTVDDIKDLPEMLQKPVAVFKYGDEKKAQNIIVELQKDGKNFLVGVHFKNQGEDVSSIRGLFNRDNHEWLNWITKGKALYVNTKKLQNLINQQRINLADVEYLDLESIESLLKKNSGVKDLFLTQEMNVEIRKSRFINCLNHEFCKLVERESVRKHI